MNNNDNQFLAVFNEVFKPILAVLMFVKSIISYIFSLIWLCWKASCSVVNKDVLIPSFIASSLILFLFNLTHFVGSESDMKEPISNLMKFLSLFIVAWLFTVIASINKAKDNNKSFYWRKHLKIGFKSSKFLLTHALFIVFLLSSIMIITYLGLIPQAGQTILSLLASPVFFIAILIILSVVSLLLSVFLFGGYYLSGDYDESLGFYDGTKALFCMISRNVADFIAVLVPAIITSIIITAVPLFLTLMALNDVIQKPTAAILVKAEGNDKFPGIYNLPEYDEEDIEKKYGGRIKGRIGSGLYSVHYHEMGADPDVVQTRQEGFNQVFESYDQRQEEYDKAIREIGALKKLGFSNSENRVNSLESFANGNPAETQYEGVDIERLVEVLDEGIYEVEVENKDGDWVYADLVNESEEFIKDYYTQSWEEWDYGADWDFDSNNNLTLTSFDDFVNETYIVTKDSVVFYASDEYYEETDTFSEQKNEFSSGKDRKVQYVGDKDSNFFRILTEIFLSISDALILGFPFMFLLASMGTIFYRLYQTSFKISLIRKIMAIILIFIAVKELNKNKENLLLGPITYMMAFSEGDEVDDTDPDAATYQTQDAK